MGFSLQKKKKNCSYEIDMPLDTEWEKVRVGEGAMGRKKVKGEKKRLKDEILTRESTAQDDACSIR